MKLTLVLNIMTTIVNILTILLLRELWKSRRK